MSKLEKWSHIADIAGAVTVVLSLVYVGFEIRQNTDVQANRTQETLLALGIEWSGWMRDSDLADLVTKGNASHSTLSHSETLQYREYVGVALNIWEHAYYSNREDLLDDERMAAWDAHFVSQFDLEGWRTIWRAARESYGRGFQMHVESSVGES